MGVQDGVFLAVQDDIGLLFRHKSLLVIPLDVTKPNVPKKVLKLELPALEEDVQNITSVQLFSLQNSKPIYALLVLFDERKLAYYEINTQEEKIQLKTKRDTPRNATCMTIGRIKIANETKKVVIVGEKTGEAVAMPFPDLDRDLKTLLGHTTSMITHLAVNQDSSLLLTADRDEKIRISKFPQTNIIQSYCLGHEASVTKISVSQKEDLIASIGIDATLKLWDLQDGTLLDSQDLPLDENVDKQILAHGSLAICPKTNTIAVVYGHSHVLLFHVNAQKKVLEPVALTDMMQLDAEPSEAHFTSDGNLLIAYKKDHFLQVFQVSTQVKTINPPWLEQVRQFASTMDISQVAESMSSHTASGTTEEADGMLEKKKIKLHHEWKSKLPGHQQLTTTTTTNN